VAVLIQTAELQRLMWFRIQNRETFCHESTTVRSFSS
jgi:hypothetical protein